LKLKLGKKYNLDYRSKMKMKKLLNILKNNLNQQIFIFLLLIVILIPAYILTPKNFKSVILITPLSDLQFKSNFFSQEDIKLKLSISDISKIENMKVEANNQDTINNLNFSPLNLFYSFYKDTINVTENKFAAEKIRVNLYGSSYEYFFSIEVNSGTKNNNINKLTEILEDVRKIIFDRILSYEKNYNKNIFIDKDNFNLVNYSKSKIVHNENKINIYFYIILLFLLSFLLNLLVLKLKRKI